MSKHSQVETLVTAAYESTEQPFAQWMWRHHVPIVAHFAKELAERYQADEDIAIASAWLHDYGDVFVHRHDASHDEITVREARRLLEQADYSSQEIDSVLNDCIALHSCKAGLLPTTIEGKVLATADALAHLNTDFYLQFAWMHLPENKTYSQYVEWVQSKLNRDFDTKIFFDEVRSEVQKRYAALSEVFLQQKKS